MPRKKGHIFLPNQIPAPMCVGVYTFTPSHMNRRYTFFFFFFFFLYAGNPPWRLELSSTWLADGPHVIWDPKRLSGQQCEPLGYVLASALNGLMCCINLCTRESLDGKQGREVFCNISGVYFFFFVLKSKHTGSAVSCVLTRKVLLLHFRFEIGGFWWQHSVLKLLWLDLHIAHWFAKHSSCDQCSVKNSPRIGVFPLGNSTQLTNCRSCWLQSELNPAFLIMLLVNGPGVFAFWCTLILRWP